MPPSREFGKIEAHVVGELHRVHAAQQEGCAPVPPAGEESPEIAEAGAHPAIEAAFDRHGGGEFRGNQRDGNAPEKRDHQQEDQGHAGAGGGDHVLETEGAAGAVREHYPDEVKQAGFAQGGLRGGGHGVGLYGETIADFRLLISDLIPSRDGRQKAEGRMPSGQPAGRQRYQPRAANSEICNQQNLTIKKPPACAGGFSGEGVGPFGPSS